MINIKHKIYSKVVKLKHIEYLLMPLSLTKIEFKRNSHNQLKGKESESMAVVDFFMYILKE